MNYLPSLYGLIYFVSGLYILYWARPRKRIATHPYCGKCGYDLFGQPTIPQRCTECGAELTPQASVVIGHQPWKKGKLGKGIWWTVLGLLCIAPPLWFKLMEHKWLHYAPTDWVVADAGSRNTVAHSEAMKELIPRIGGDQLSDVQWQAFVESAIRYQSDAETFWDPTWNALVIKARSNNHLPDAVWDRYLDVLAMESDSTNVSVRLMAEADLAACRKVP